MKLIAELLTSLPPGLRERTRVLGSKPLPDDAEFVLYWMRTAVRVEENQALNAAIHLSNQLKLPLLVYHGLSERYPYASDRHHTFILQGARDVQAEFASRNVVYAFHLERSDNRGPHLKMLAQRSALIVTEEMPVEPLRSWTSALGRVSGRSVVSVDTACVVPMQLPGKSFQRAFSFRDATKKLFHDRITAPALDITPQVEIDRHIDLPFSPIDLQNADIDALLGDCAIDHSIGPVPHTVGGSIAGYARWSKFKANGLARYESRRNNALVDGVSRMSAYLHYGMVSPMRIAREAAAENNQGAEKYLDELLIWRELAYNFCFYRPDHGRLSALPDWANKTLSEHQTDTRPDVLSWETMARGRSGDLLWDAAQSSLLIHGELHNNVRMTWGKAILTWTFDAKAALARIIDLNHRYALDGRDPASYGGILWCLGLFDRPFSPPRPILGTVRDRSTQQHAKRLDPKAYFRKATRPLYKPRIQVAVIGAGISGLACARTLADHGFDVSVFEKSRGVGGRMSTRHVAQELSFDHGAQYFTARDKRFQRYLCSWIQDGLVQPWRGRIVALEKGSIKQHKRGTNRYVAVPGMNAIGKHLAKDLKLKFETQVAPLQRSQGRWKVHCDDGTALGEFDFAITAVPAGQAAKLLAATPELAEQAGNTLMNGCWAVMLAFSQTLNLEFDGAFVHGSPLSWISRNSSKPGRTDKLESWVLHASSDWTAEHIDETPDTIAELLIDEFWKSVGQARTPSLHQSAHRWRFALPPNPLSDDCLFDRQLKIGACGDWCGGPRVEGAFLSGMAVAGRVLGLANAIKSPADSEVDRQLPLF